MSKHLRFLVLVCLLPALGLGCLKIGPRVVNGPDGNRVVKKEDQGERKAPTFDEQYESASSTDTAIILELNGGQANLIRSGVEVTAADGVEISSGDRVVVKSGAVYLVYPDAGKSRLETGTDVSVLTEESQNGIFTELELAAGRVWTRFERLLGSDEQYSVVANGVVATVRGTAFGVAVDDDGVDVQVADHEVQVTTDEQSAGETEFAVEPVKLSAGEGLKIATRGLLLKDIKVLRNAIRKLGENEQIAEGFKFGSLRIPLEKLRRPPSILRLKVPPSLSPNLFDLRQRMMLRAAILKSTSSFMAPLRSPTTTESAPLNITPKIEGPSS
ncbi:FecR domain-containing protein [Candidatus Uhrbacteria bacterium]|nr:FecR domain-containing protein [Candidatus Uhrbacteria bacterium]